MEFRKTNNTYTIRLIKDEPVMATLTQFCKDNHIKHAWLQGLGAVKEISCGYYKLAEKRYYFTQYPDIVEVASMVGNVAIKEGEPFLHVHAVFTDEQNQAFGGHVEEMKVGVTLEVLVRVYDTEIERLHDEEIGLFLMSCSK